MHTVLITYQPVSGSGDSAYGEHEPRAAAARAGPARPLRPADCRRERCGDPLHTVATPGPGCWLPAALLHQWQQCRRRPRPSSAPKRLRHGASRTALLWRPGSNLYGAATSAAPFGECSGSCRRHSSTASPPPPSSSRCRGSLLSAGSTAAATTTAAAAADGTTTTAAAFEKSEPAEAFPRPDHGCLLQGKAVRFLVPEPVRAVHPATVTG